MIDIQNSSRIIGDFLEINTDIVKTESELNHISFFKKRKCKKLRNQLIETAKQIPKLNRSLKKENVYELINYIWSNFAPSGAFGSIQTSFREGKDLIAVMLFDDCRVVITLYANYPNMEFDIHSWSDESKKHLVIERDNVTDFSNGNQSIMKKINQQLLKEISNYIIYTLHQYDRKE